MSLKDRIREAMDAATLKPADLARATGKSPGAVTQWLDGTIKSLKADTAALIEQATGYRSTWLVTGKGPKLTAESEIVNGSQHIDNQHEHDISEKNDAKLIPAGGVGRGRLVPVVGMARLGDNGFYEEISSMAGAGDGMVEAYSNDPNAYALRVRGDSMFPAIRDGWYVIVEPGSVPTPGDYVLIKLKTGQKMVKELIMQRPDGITVVSVNGDTRRTIDAQEIDPHFGIQAVSAILSPRKWIPSDV